MKLDKYMADITNDVEIPIPKYSADFLGITIFVWEKSEYSIEPLESFPYEPDGKIPMIFLQIGKVEFIFESKILYKFLYKRKYNQLPMGLK